MPVDTAEIAARLAKRRYDWARIELFAAELPNFDLTAMMGDLRRLGLR